MLKENQRIINRINMAADGMLILVSYYISLYIRFVVMGGKVSIKLWRYPFNIVVLFFSIIMVLVYAAFKMYGSHRFKKQRDEALNIFLINGGGIMFFTSMMYMYRVADFSRGVLIIYWLVASVLVTAKRIISRKVLRRLGAFGYGKKKVLIVGDGRLATNYVKDIAKNSHLGIEIIGYLGSEKENMPMERLGRFEDLENILGEKDIDEIIVALESHEIDIMKTVIACAEKEGTRLSLIPFFNEYFPTHVTMETIGGSRLIDVRATPLDNIFNSSVKRIMDVVGSLALIVLTGPIMVIAVIGVRLSGPGKIFFTQRRIGLNKKPFNMLKFRSMRENSRETTGWSTAEDDRKTRFGSIIRKLSIDELPQLFNVLKGDMSLVGPRPEVPYYVQQFKEDVPLYLVRQQVRPGMTGWAQIHGLRGDTSIEARVEYDIWYIQNWSLWLDIQILIKTALGGFINNESVVKKEGKK